MNYKEKRTLIYLLDALLLFVFFAIMYSNNNGILSFPMSAQSDSSPSEDIRNIDYRQEMRNWVIEISSISKNINPDFLIIPQNCTELLTSDGTINATLQSGFINAIDGIGQEGLSYGYGRFNSETDSETKELLTAKLNIAKSNDVKVIVLDYCTQETKINLANNFNDNNKFIGYQSSHLELTDIPESTPHYNNVNDITSLNKAQNCIFLLNPQAFETSEALIQALINTDYDILFIDAFFTDDEMLSKEQVNRLKTKSNGAKRLVISYLSIGEAEDYRYYYKSSYSNSPPSWLLDENPHWQGNYIVEYWNTEWHEIIATGENSYLKKIIDAGFDGAYLDIVDGYQNFE